MNTRKLVWCGLIVLTPLTIPGQSAGAQDFDRHGYVFVNVGNTETDRRLSIADVIDGDDDSYEVGGGFAFTPYLSVEGSYQRFGRPDGFVGCPVDVLCIALVPFSRENVEVDGWTGALRGTLPVTTSLSVFARAGLLAWETSARTAALNDSGTDMLYGLGLAADINDRFGVQLSYEKAGVDVETLKLGLKVRL